MYFIYDPPHLIKTVRNNILNCKKRLWNKSYFGWNVVKEIIEEDLLLGDLRFFPKLTAVHANPSSYEKMKVSVAAQTLSHTVGLELKRRGHEEFGKFVMLIDEWFDMMNTSFYHAQRKGKSNMKPFLVNDQFTAERLYWLKNEFIGYFRSWKHEVQSTNLVSSDAGRKSMLLSKTRESGLLMTTKAMINLVEDCFSAGAKFVMTRRINQDPLESHFGHQRQRGRRSDAPTAPMFAYNVRAINCFRKSVIGSNVTQENS